MFFIFIYLHLQQYRQKNNGHSTHKFVGGRNPQCQDNKLKKKEKKA